MLNQPLLIFLTWRRISGQQRIWSLRELSLLALLSITSSYLQEGKNNEGRKTRRKFICKVFGTLYCRFNSFNTASNGAMRDVDIFECSYAITTTTPASTTSATTVTTAPGMVFRFRFSKQVLHLFRFVRHDDCSLIHKNRHFNCNDETTDCCFHASQSHYSTSRCCDCSCLRLRRKRKGIRMIHCT